MSASGKRCTICQAPASPTGSSPAAVAVPRVPLRARPHLLELVGADAASAAPEGRQFVGLAAVGVAKQREP